MIGLLPALRVLCTVEAGSTYFGRMNTELTRTDDSNFDRPSAALRGVLCTAESTYFGRTQNVEQVPAARHLGLSFASCPF